MTNLHTSQLATLLQRLTAGVMQSRRLPRFAFVLTVGLTWLSFLNIDISFDDSFMFVRYAQNILEHGTIAWNVSDGPVYGATSQVYLWGVILPLVAWLGSATLAIPIIGSNICWFIFAALFFRDIQKALQESAASVFDQWMVWLVAYPVFLWTCRVGQFGMDASLAALWVYQVARIAILSSGRTRLAVSGLLTGASYLVRPDIVPLCAAVFAIGCWLAVQKRIPVRGAVAFAMLGFVASLAYLWWAFGALLPLSYAVKVDSIYRSDSSFFRDYAGTRFYFTKTFYEACSPLLAMTAFSLWRSQQNPPSKPIVLLLMLASIVFFNFQYHFVLPIMGIAARYYVPMIGLLGIVFLLVVKEARPSTWWVFAGGQGKLARTVLAGTSGLTFVGVSLILCSSISWAGVSERFASQEILRVYRSWFACPEVMTSASTELSFASTEVGLLSAIHDGDILDLASLNSKLTYSERRDMGALVIGVKPDVVLLPHWLYWGYRKSLISNSDFLEQYELYPYASTGTLNDYAVRRKSPIYGELDNCLRDPMAGVIGLGNLADQAERYSRYLPARL